MLAYVCDKDALLKLFVDALHDLLRCDALVLVHVQRMFLLPVRDLIQPFLMLTALDVFQHGFHGVLGVCHDGDIHLDVPGDGGRVNVHMDNFGILGKLVNLSGDTVIKTGADGEKQVTLTDGTVSGIAAVHSHIAHIEFVAGRDGAFSHNGGDNRDSGSLRKSQGCLVCPSDIHTSAHEEQRLLGVFHQRHGFF